ncbi:MAG: DNA-methyltransferase [Candidatus Saccharibacteria bacterium]|nr:DNA-methyltransferase [Candidatus Saccharibacteria bacterium]
MIKTKTQRKYLLTPLRYPGGKTSLFEFFDEVIKRHNWRDMTYIEPYAGGAGAAISLLLLERVERIVINDYDPAIYSFWKAITERTDEFIYLVENTPITIEEWDIQKQIYKAADIADQLRLGYATFFLNRTNRSGIMNAGPIGGKAQSGEWKIDARFNRKALIEKIKLISLYSDRITVLNEDGVDVITAYANDPRSFFYVDPPYFVKGTDLYLNAFKLQDHQKLANSLSKHAEAKWLLSYDNEKEILDLYPTREYRDFDLKYSANHNSKMGSELMILSNTIDSAIIDAI